MSQLKTKKQNSDKQESKVLSIEPQSSLFPFGGFKNQAIIICIVALALYFNSLSNEFALDDGIVITKNDYVQKGISGIGKILSTDAYESFYRQMNAKDQLSGGRYRPLSIVTFAIEQQFFGENWHVRHFFNVAFFLCSLVVMLHFLRTVVFPSKPDIAFLTTLLFAIHPIHTEVIANVKSRDEILSLLFILLTLLFTFNYYQNQRIKNNLWKALICFFLALLSKEYAVVLIVLIPIMLYLFSTKELSLSENFRKITPFAFVIVAYLCIRFSIVVVKADVKNDEVLNNPYLFAKANEKLPTKISTLLNYIKLLIFPHPLSADYSFKQIPYKSIAHWSVWVSLFVHGGMFYLAWKWIKERNPLGFAVAFYLLLLALVANIAFDIGATMGERLIYHSSLGFCMLAAFYIIKFVEKTSSSVQARRGILLFASAILVVACGFKTIERNADWKNDITLFTKDVETVPNSALANGNAGARYIDLCEKPENKDHKDEFINKAIGYLSKSVSIHPKYVNSYLNLGLAYYKLNDFEKAKENWDKAKQYYPNNPYLKTFYPLIVKGYLDRAGQLGQQQKFDESLLNINKAIQVDSTNADVWYNLGGLYFTIKQYDKAQSAWLKTLQINPNHAEAQKGLQALTPVVK